MHTTKLQWKMKLDPNVNITVSALYRFSLMHLIFNHLLQEATCIKAAVLHYVISLISTKTWHDMKGYSKA